MDLFDFDATAADDSLPPNPWKEVPQALFDSWSNERQLAYCRDRDENAALYAPTLEEGIWFQKRANTYAKEIEACRTNRPSSPVRTPTNPSVDTSITSEMSWLADEL